MAENRIPVAAVVGPTATGKTELGIGLCQRLGGEVVSCDSMQVYRGMDIGTAKITPEEMQGVPHHMLDILDPDEPFNALTFKERAQQTIDDILSRSHLPMIVGGTGLYVNGLIYDYRFQGERDDGYRARIFDEMVADPEKAAAYYDALLAERPDLRGVIFPGDHFRISRALEIIRTEGKAAIKNFDMPQNYQSPYALCLIGLTMDRQRLYERINLRVDLMLENGLVEEVEKLLDKGYNR